MTTKTLEHTLSPLGGPRTLGGCADLTVGACPGLVLGGGYGSSCSWARHRFIIGFRLVQLRYNGSTSYCRAPARTKISRTGDLARLATWRPGLDLATWRPDGCQVASGCHGASMGAGNLHQFTGDLLATYWRPTGDLLATDWRLYWRLSLATSHCVRLPPESGRKDLQDPFSPKHDGAHLFVKRTPTSPYNWRAPAGLLFVRLRHLRLARACTARRV